MPTPKFTNVFFGRGGALKPITIDGRSIKPDGFRDEVIQEKKGDGRYIVAGHNIPTTGQQEFKVGDKVTVAFKNFIPVAIVAHRWRRAQFEPVVEEIEAGDWQNIIFKYSTDDIPAIFLSNLEETFVMDLTEVGVPLRGAVGLRVDQVLFCANDPSVVLVVIANQISLNNSTDITLKLLKIARSITSPTIPLKATDPKTIDLQTETGGPVKTFKKVAFSQISNTVRARGDLTLRTITYSLNFTFRLFAPKIDLFRDTATPAPATASSSDDIVTAGANIGGTENFGIDFVGSYFCIKQNGNFKIFLLFEEGTLLSTSVPSSFNFDKPVTTFTATGFDPGIDLDASGWSFSFTRDDPTSPQEPTENITRSFTTQNTPVSILSSINTLRNSLYPSSPVYLVELTAPEIIHKTAGSASITANLFSSVSEDFVVRKEIFFVNNFTAFRFKKTISRNTLEALLFTPNPGGIEVPPDPTFNRGGIVSSFPVTNVYTNEPFISEQSAAALDITTDGRKVWVFYSASPTVNVQGFSGSTFAFVTKLSNSSNRTDPSLPLFQNYLGKRGETLLPIVELQLQGSGGRIAHEWDGSLFKSFGVAGVDRMINEKFIMYRVFNVETFEIDFILINRITSDSRTISEATETALALKGSGGGEDEELIPDTPLMVSRKRIYFPAKFGDFTAEPGLLKVVNLASGEIDLIPTKELPKQTNPDNYFSVVFIFGFTFGLTSALFPRSLENA